MQGSCACPARFLLACIVPESYYHSNSHERFPAVVWCGGCVLAQEEVIKSLEALLGQAAQRGKRAAAAEQEVKQLQ